LRGKLHFFGYNLEYLTLSGAWPKITKTLAGKDRQRECERKKGREVGGGRDEIETEGRTGRDRKINRGSQVEQIEKEKWKVRDRKTENDRVR
jgi:hypothetical protein